MHGCEEYEEHHSDAGSDDAVAQVFDRGVGRDVGGVFEGVFDSSHVKYASVVVGRRLGGLVGGGEGGGMGAVLRGAVVMGRATVRGSHLIDGDGGGRGGAGIERLGEGIALVDGMVDGLAAPVLTAHYHYKHSQEYQEYEYAYAGGDQYGHHHLDRARGYAAGVDGRLYVDVHCPDVGVPEGGVDGCDQCVAVIGDDDC